MAKELLRRPDSGCMETAVAQDGQIYLLNFDPSVTTFERHCRDLFILFENAAGIVLQEFFSIVEKGELFLEWPGGTLLSGKDIAKMVDDLLPGGHVIQNQDTQDGLEQSLLFPAWGAYDHIGLPHVSLPDPQATELTTARQEHEGFMSSQIAPMPFLEREGCPLLEDLLDEPAPVSSSGQKSIPSFEALSVLPLGGETLISAGFALNLPATDYLATMLQAELTERGVDQFMLALLHMDILL